MIKIVKELIKNNIKVQEIESYDTETKEQEKYYLAFEYNGKFWCRLGRFRYEYNTLESVLEEAIEQVERMDRDEKLIKQIRNELKKRGITKTEERKSFITDYIALSKLTAKLTAGSINKIIAMCSYPDRYEDVSEDTQDSTEDNGEISEQKKEGEKMKYKIENIEEYKENLKEIRNSIDKILELDLSEKELTDSDISKIIHIQEVLTNYQRLAWVKNPKIKIVSSDGTELTVR